MQRLTILEIQTIKKLTKEGYFLNSICSKIKKPKTTIYYHFRKVRGRTYFKIIPSKNEELIGEFIGLFAGDGSYHRDLTYRHIVKLHFAKSEEPFTKELIQKILIKLFDKGPMVFVEGNKLNLVYYSKEIYNLIKKYLDWNLLEAKTYSVRLKTREHKLPFIVGFIRGSIDSDGHLSQKRVTFASVSNLLINDISFFLNHLGLKHGLYCQKNRKGNRRDLYSIEIKRGDLTKFMEVINPRNRVKMNVHRLGFEFLDKGLNPLSPRSSGWKPEILDHYTTGA